MIDDGLTQTTPDESTKMRWETRTETDTKRETIIVEKVENGYIKTVDIDEKQGDSWKYSCKKYISTENPMEEPSILDKLAKLASKLDL